MYIYIHLPFCRSICHYCDFPKVFYDKKFIATYLDELKCEIESRYQNEEVCSIYIGGGTPTCLDEVELKKLLEITNLFQKKDKIEFSIESNVESLTDEKIKLLASFGVNRVSLGVQSFQKDILKELNRHHTKEQVFEVVSSLKGHGIHNINMDYIYGVSEDFKVIEEDMKLFLALDIPHISCYSLIIEDNTVFGIQKRSAIDEDIEYQMYQFLENTLKRNHYIHYEVSNYAKENYCSFHNLNYWNNGEYYGFGLGAVSYLDQYRISNTKNLTRYLKGDYVEGSILESFREQMSNELILGLRKVEGISVSSFYEKYHINIFTLYHIEELLQEGKLVLKGDYLSIPPRYYYVANEILVNFV